MIDPSIIEAKIVSARARDNAVTAKLLGEISRLAVFSWGDTAVQQAKTVTSGIPQDVARPTPENGSYAYQLYSAICFTIDARVELKLLELIASPDFYSALMRSAAEIAP
jgi:hypothetical protein